MPDNWVPPVPAWSADLGDSSALAIAYYGVQHHTSDTRDFETAFALLRHGPDAPEHIERGRFDDLAGLVNEVFVCYWRVPGTYVRFAEQSAFARWLADDARLSSDVGVWVEAFRIPMTRFETLFSSQCPAGAARLTDNPMAGPIDEHGYWGGMRDRIPASNADELSSPLDGTPNSADGTETRGRRIGTHRAGEPLPYPLGARLVGLSGRRARELPPRRPSNAHERHGVPDGESR